VRVSDAFRVLTVVLSPTAHRRTYAVDERAKRRLPLMPLVAPDIRDKYPRPALDTRVRRVGGRLLVARGNDAFELSDVAGFIWERCDGSRTVGDIAIEVVESYDVEPQVATDDMREIIQELESKGFLELEA
jgi:hypothetical protein